jgi:hypothetical protein
LTTRDRLLQLPAKLAPEIISVVVADPDVRTVETMMEAAIRELLADFVQEL